MDGSERMKRFLEELQTDDQKRKKSNKKAFKRTKDDFRRA